MSHDCAQCKYLSRTSPEQRFLRCDFWCSPTYPVKGIRAAYDTDYVIGHCHVQPEATACPYFEGRADGKRVS